MNRITRKNMSVGLCTLGLVSLAFFAGPTHAGDHKIVQKNKSFPFKKLSAKVGDTLVFVNEDKVSHNMFSKTAGHEFEIKVQKPGTTEKKKLDKAGKFKVKCAIHPKMKLKITVE